MQKVKRNNFGIRVKSHERYVNEVIEELRYLGYYARKLLAYEEHPFPPELLNVLLNSNDSTAYFIRFQPDMASVRQKEGGPFGKIALWEIKSAITESKNFAFELAPWEMCRKVTKAVSADIFFCFPAFYYRKANEFMPDSILIPNRWSEEELKKIKEKYPNTYIKYIRWEKGSGTVFGLIYPKQYKVWSNLRQRELFI